MPEGVFVLTYVLVGVLLLVGLVGSVVPVLPGAALILVAAGLFAVVTGFDPVGPGRLLVLALLAILAYALDYLAGALGAKRFGGSRWAVLGALLGALVGLFFGLFGLLLGPVLGAVAGELLGRRPWKESLKSGVGTAVGLVVGTLAKFGLALVMVVLFLWWAVRG